MEISFPEVLLRLLIATLLGAIFGWEREVTEHNAGLRTNALVALGTALFTIISGYGFATFINFPHIQIDPTRIASYIIAGIGFLGAGTIFFRSDSRRVHGLTTAATVWIVAAVGMACGVGMYVYAIVTTGIALFVLVVLKFAAPYLLPQRDRNQYYVRLTFTVDMVSQTIEKMYQILSRYFSDVDIVRIKEEDSHIAEAIVMLGRQIKQGESIMIVLDELRQLQSIKEVTITRHRWVLTDESDK